MISRADISKGLYLKIGQGILESGVDETDIKLCQLLMANSRLPYNELGIKLGLSINAVHKRVMALTELGIIRAFVARLDLSALGAVTVWVFGRSQSKHLQEAHLRLQKNDSIYWVAYSGGDFLYVGGYLKDISQLESYVKFVKDEGEITDPTVAILPSMPRRSSIEELRQTDYQIISSLHHDARKPLTDVASELHLTAKTVHNRLEKMVENRLVDFTIDWYPDASNDIFSLFHFLLGPNAESEKVFSALMKDFSPNILFPVPFSNLPNQLVAFGWTNTMKQLEELREKMSAVKGIESVMLNVLQIGHSFDTWRDNLIMERSNSRISP
jgi:DNA-binding Lrp family transcriptional regulator